MSHKLDNNLHRLAVKYFQFTILIIIIDYCDSIRFECFFRENIRRLNFDLRESII